MRYVVEEQEAGKYVIISVGHGVLPVIFTRLDEARKIAELMEKQAPCDHTETDPSAPVRNQSASPRYAVIAG